MDVDSDVTPRDHQIAALFFGYRYAKRLLQIDHPLCDVCKQPSVGVHIIAVGVNKKAVASKCEAHWTKECDIWQVRWDHLEDAKQLIDDEPPEQKSAIM